MQFSEFQNSITIEFKHYPDPLTYAILSVGGEAGEVVEKYKKTMRHVHPSLVKTSDSRDALLDELGDVLWAITRVAGLLGADLETIAQMNMKKLAYRRIHGKEGEPTCKERADDASRRA